jgi:dipeptidyl aminopeptidase/acylaminoacyl peptidase
LLVWDVEAGTETELVIDLPGELAADFTPDARALLVWHTHAARTRLHRYDLATGRLTDLPTAAGCVGSADVRPDGTVEYSCSSAAQPPTVRALHTDGTDRVLLVPPGTRAPGSVPVEDLWVDGPGGPVHALIARPEGATEPGPAVVSLHGGPHAATRTGSPRCARCGWTPGSPSSRSTTAAPRATAAPGATPSRGGRG